MSTNIFHQENHFSMFIRYSFSPPHLLNHPLLPISSFHSPILPAFRIHHRKLFRPDHSPVSIRREHIAGYHISLSVYLLHRRMSHHLQHFLIPIHFPRCKLRSVPGCIPGSSRPEYP